MERQFTFHEDAGHGWLVVAADEVLALGLKDKISQFSYKKDGHAYLEEDLDAGVFLDALKEKYPNVQIKLDRDYVTHSYIRDYPSFRG